MKTRLQECWACQNRFLDEIRCERHSWKIDCEFLKAQSQPKCKLELPEQAFKCQILSKENSVSVMMISFQWNRKNAIQNEFSNGPVLFQSDDLPIMHRNVVYFFASWLRTSHCTIVSGKSGEWKQTFGTAVWSAWASDDASSLSQFQTRTIPPNSKSKIQFVHTRA